MKREQPDGFEVLDVLLKGNHRSIVVAGEGDELRKWIMRSGNRPHPNVLLAAIQRVADLSHESLMKHRDLFKHLTGTNPKLFEIRKDQARLLCLQLKSGDLLVVHWIIKKTGKIPASDLQTAQRRAKEYLSNEYQN